MPSSQPNTNHRRKMCVLVLLFFFALSVRHKRTLNIEFKSRDMRIHAAFTVTAFIFVVVCQFYFYQFFFFFAVFDEHIRFNGIFSSNFNNLLLQNTHIFTTLSKDLGTHKICLHQNTRQTIFFYSIDSNHWIISL